MLHCRRAEEYKQRQISYKQHKLRPSPGKLKTTSSNTTTGTGTGIRSSKKKGTASRCLAGAAGGKAAFLLMLNAKVVSHTTTSAEHVWTAAGSSGCGGTVMVQTSPFCSEDAAGMQWVSLAASSHSPVPSTRAQGRGPGSLWGKPFDDLA